MDLYAALPNRLGYLFQHAADTAYRQSDQALQERLGIGLSQLKIMTMLQAYPDIPQRRLGVGLGQTEASISRQVKLLERKGMVAVKVDPRERRRRLVSLTGRGIKMAEAAEAVITQQREQLFAALTTKQQQQLQTILDKLHEYTCQPGKPASCDHPFDLLSTYSAQQDASLIT
jgi:DNA-binding MarR family transcriptional regulator